MIDNRKIQFYNEKSRGKEIVFSDNHKKKNPAAASLFYEFIPDDSLIIKYFQTEIDELKLYNMLERFIEKKDKIKNIDLPTAYYKEGNSIKGLIVPYYKNGISLYQLARTGDLSTLQKYYHHDDEVIHNLYILCQDILNKLEELVDNGILYYDSNLSNFIVVDNTIKIIDFDYKYLEYNITKETLKTVLRGFEQLFYELNKKFKLEDLCIYYPKKFSDMQRHISKTETKIRKRKMLLK